jgi:hypothetical protein
MILMKRTKFVMLAVKVALVLMGAGYAAWTQVFTIQSTVNTGELFVKVGSDSNTYEVLNEDDEVVASGNLDTTDDYLNLSVDDTATVTNLDGDVDTLTELTFALSDMYPGTRVISVITFENLGTLKTITAYSTDGDNSIELDAQSNQDLWDDLEFTVTVGAVDTVISGEDTDGSKLEDIAEAIADAVGELDVDDTVTVTIVQELPIESENDTQGQTVEWTIPLIFGQYNPTAEAE